MIEIAVKLVRLRTALAESDPAHISGAEMWRNPLSRPRDGG
jgi:hypothetical protein